MRTKLSLSTVVLCVLCSTLQAQLSFVDQMIPRGDVADLAFRPSDALQDYLPAAKAEPNNVPLLLRIARQYRHLISDMKTDEMRLKVGALSLQYAVRAAALAPGDSEAQLSPAITYGKMLPFQSHAEQYAASALVKTAADLAIKLDPRNDNAWHVLGRWHQGLAGVGAVKRALGGVLYGKLPTSTYAEAIACFDKAIAINPKRLRHYIEKGHTCALMADPSGARTYLEIGLAMPELEKDDHELKKLGRDTLATLPR